MLDYLRHHFRLLRAAAAEAMGNSSSKEGPVPGPRLRHRVHGSMDRIGYLEVGRQSWWSIESLARAQGRDPGSFRSVLDFGCGSGRVIRNIPPAEDREIVGVDIDAKAISWNRRHLKAYRFETVAPCPPLSFSDDSFDLAFAVSVFTHLDEAMQFAWLSELRRVLRPGGLLVVSVHGDHHRSLTHERIDMPNGFSFRNSSRSFFKKDGLPNFYQDAQHTREYVTREWARHYEILDYVEQGLAGHQDAVVCRPN